jgi:FtsP/CotA-like multicopper oxidase with cupredoxin domain
MSRLLLIVGLLLSPALAAADDTDSPYPKNWPYTPITTPNGFSAPWEMKDGVKEFKLTVEEISWDMADGMTVKAWGYNGATPGPTLEWVQGDRIRILVTNTLPEKTVVHWHGLLIPGASGMDGVQGLTQKGIPPGETYFYEFTVNQPPGTLMYHSHGDEMVQIGMGSYGFVIIHPKNPRSRRVDRDFAIFLNEWSVTPGTSTPDTSVMTDFNLFTFNSRIYPSTDPLIAKTGEKIRIRIGSVSQDLHPLHLHGHAFEVTGTDGGPVPPAARWPETTVVVAPGQTRDVEFIAVAGDWAFHCHRRHHPMNAMGHDVPNMLGVSQAGVEDQIKELVPGYMAMGETGMGEMADMHMPLPRNTMPMMGGEGPFGAIGMGGMFTVLKVRDRMKSYTDEEAGWFENPPGTVSEPWPVPAE